MSFSTCARACCSHEPSLSLYRSIHFWTTSPAFFFYKESADAAGPSRSLNGADDEASTDHPAEPNPDGGAERRGSGEVESTEVGAPALGIGSGGGGGGGGGAGGSSTPAPGAVLLEGSYDKELSSIRAQVDRRSDLASRISRVLCFSSRLLSLFSSGAMDKCGKLDWVYLFGVVVQLFRRKHCALPGKAVIFERTRGV